MSTPNPYSATPGEPAPTNVPPAYGAAQGMSPLNQVPEAPKKKKKKGCFLWGAVAVVGLVTVAVLTSQGESDPATTATSSKASDADAAVGGIGTAETNPAPVGETVHMKRMDATVTSFYHAGPDFIGATHSCAVVDLTNTDTAKKLDINPTNFKLTDTHGVEHDMTIMADHKFDFVALNPGANYSGTVCFETDNAAGDYTLTFQEGFAGGKGFWKLNG